MASVQRPQEEDRRLQRDVPAARVDGQPGHEGPSLGPHRKDHQPHLRFRCRELHAAQHHGGAPS